MSLVVNLYYKDEFIRYAFIDENISTIKDTIFAFYNKSNSLTMFPSFIKLVYIDENMEEILLNDDTKPIFYFFKEIPSKLNIVNILEDPKSNSIVSIQDFEVENTINKFKNIGYNLTNSDLTFYNNIINKKTEEIPNFINKLNKLQEEFLKKYSKIYNNEYYNNLYEKAPHFEISDYVNNIYYNQITLDIKGQDLIGSRIIDLDKLFNVFQLTDNIPYMALGRFRNDPVIKVHTSLKHNEKLVNSWILNEKKKAGLATYKKVKGILLKYKDADNWININILYNGFIEAKIKYDDTSDKDKADTDITNIYKVVLRTVEKCINQINSISGIFLHSKKLDSLKNSITTIRNISGECESNILINRLQLSKILNNKIISDHLFELKETIGDDIMSIFYKNHYKEASDSKGIIVNIKDNNYKFNSSIINIYSAINYKQIYIIISKLLLLSSLLDIDKSDKVKQKLKEKSKIKDLSKKGVVTDSKNCQKAKQPNLDGIPLKGSYVLEYQNKRYTCPNSKYPFPGFTNQNIVCCSVKDQRGNFNYIANTNPDLIDIKISPSNQIISIQDDLKTYALKLVSGIDKLPISNSVYYYLNSQNELENISQESIIQFLDDNDDIWLDPVSLYIIINPPPKQTCSKIPNIHNKSDYDINKPCELHIDANIFAYNNNSLPCCFKNKKDPIVIKKDKQLDITKEHILKYDKQLQYKRIGYLNPTLDSLFNKYLKIKSSQFYRMGSLDYNFFSLYNSIIICFHQNIKNINNSNKFHKHISKILTENNESESLTNIINAIQKLLNIKIIILETTNDGFKITCNNWYSDDDIVVTPKKTIVLFKIDDVFEILINITNDKQVRYIYNENDKLVDFLVNYEKNSCIIKTQFPHKYPYSAMPSIKQLMKLLQHELVGQIIDKRVVYGVSNKGFLIPVKESNPIDNLEKIPYNSIHNSKLSHNISHYIKYYKYISNKTKLDLKLLNVILDDSNNIISATTSFGPIIPLTKEPYKNHDIPNATYSNYINYENKSTNNSSIFYKNLQTNKIRLFNLKKDIAKKLSHDSKNNILKIIKNTNLNRFDKISAIHDILLLYITELNNDTLDVFLYQIANEILNDNVENLFLNNIVLSEFYNPDEIIRRDSEKILYNITEIKDFFR